VCAKRRKGSAMAHAAVDDSGKQSCAGNQIKSVVVIYLIHARRAFSRLLIGYSNKWSFW
jgi:hypothetical protein